jgi:DNA-binding FadR family transcriptional regulator
MSIDGQRPVRGPVFGPVHTGAGLPDTVAQRIGEAINMGLIADGEQLPAEERLSAQLNVSTVTLRGALVILREQGLVETRRGRGGGSFAKAPQGTTRSKLLDRMALLTTTELRELADEQLAIAGVSAMLAARRAVSGNVTRLEQLIEELRRTTTDVDAARADSRFHIEVAVSSQSERLTRREMSLQAEYMDLLWIPGGNTDPTLCADQHAAIADAIRTENADRARELAEEHAASNFRRLIDLHLRMTS